MFLSNCAVKSLIVGFRDVLKYHSVKGIGASPPRPALTSHENDSDDILGPVQRSVKFDSHVKRLAAA